MIENMAICIVARRKSKSDIEESLKYEMNNVAYKVPKSISRNIFLDTPVNLVTLLEIR